MHVCVKYASDARFLKKKKRELSASHTQFQVSRPPRQFDRLITEILGGAWKESDEGCFLFQNSFLFLSVNRILCKMYYINCTS